MQPLYLDLGRARSQNSDLCCSLDQFQVSSLFEARSLSRGPGTLCRRLSLADELFEAFGGWGWMFAAAVDRP